MPGSDQVSFGKLPKRSDGRTLALPGLLTSKKPAFPATVHNETYVWPWRGLGNFTLQDCAIAAAGHAEMLWAAKYRRPGPDPTLAQITHAYSKITGYDRDDPATDKGSDLLSVLKYWQKTGIAGQKIGAFAEILPADVDQLKWAIATLDLAYVGIQLPAAWEVPEATHPRPGFDVRRRLWNPATWQNPFYGHCVIYTGYGPGDTFTCVSWGQVMTVTGAFHRAFCDEAYAIISPERLSGGVATADLDLRFVKESLDLARKVAPR